MKNPINASAILVDVHDKLKRRIIRKVNGYYFSANDMAKVIRFFEAEQAANAVTYPALVQLEGMVYDGEITIGRDGSLQVRLTH